MRSKSLSGARRSIGKNGRAPGASSRYRRKISRAPIGEVLHQGHVFALPALQYRTAVARAQVSHPVRLLTEHGHQKALALVVGDNYRERNRPPRLVPTHFNCCSLVGSDPGPKDDGAQPVCDARRPPRTASAILPSLDPANNATEHASTVRAGRQPVVQGRSFSGLRTAQMCLIRSPATSNANTVTVTPSC